MEIQNEVLTKDYQEWKEKSVSKRNGPKNDGSDTIGASNILSSSPLDIAKWAHTLKKKLKLHIPADAIINSRAGYCTGLISGREYKIGELLYSDPEFWLYGIADANESIGIKCYKYPATIIKSILMPFNDSEANKGEANIKDIVININNGIFGVVVPIQK